jgi:hypothetical protein
MTNHFLTLQQAAQMTGKSLPTITRLARNNQHTNHVKKQGKKYLVSMELISQNYSVTNHNDELTNHDESPGTKPPPQGEADNIKNETITLLKDLLKQKNEELNQKNRELERKDVQIQRKDDQIDSLTERIRENNIILQNLQSRLQIPEKFTETQVFEQEPQPDHPHTNTPTEEHKGVILSLVKQGGYSYRQIANYLNQHGYLNTRGGKFTKNSVEKIVSRLRNKGRL